MRHTETLDLERRRTPRVRTRHLEARGRSGHEPKDSLPRAHACICTIDLPEYSSYAALRRAVHIALSLGSIGFDDAAVQDPADADAEDAADAPGGVPSTGSRRDAGPRVPT